MEEIEESITSESICRVLLIPRSSYLDACQEFPHDAMQMAMNTKTLVSCKMMPDIMPFHFLQTLIKQFWAMSWTFILLIAMRSIDHLPIFFFSERRLCIS